MNTTFKTKPPIWFWIVSVVALVWNAMGVLQYLGQTYQTESFKSQYTNEQLEIISNTPAWAIAAFATAVFGGILASIALVLRKKAAYPLFLISLIGVVVQMIHNLFLVKSVDIYGPFAAIITGMIIIFSLLFLWFSKKSIANHWIS
ncbi:hypothetical protein [Mangrovimonas sp. DI 80]|uniref:hypothetical protein n=1 Tax=Mangrovimonas sp. DI 80 TaxID=1779330 RepID=UPI000977E002|nr:hypothetical protein [Mangrovimonas sp. DI 80]OMP30721.1 hypothetical protein BKM32_10820 [Mangrovimonas sp. DI 80]